MGARIEANLGWYYLKSTASPYLHQDRQVSMAQRSGGYWPEDAYWANGVYLTRECSQYFKISDWLKPVHFIGMAEVITSDSVTAVTICVPGVADWEKLKKGSIDGIIMEGAEVAEVFEPEDRIKSHMFGSITYSLLGFGAFVQMSEDNSADWFFKVAHLGELKKLLVNPEGSSSEEIFNALRLI